MKNILSIFKKPTNKFTPADWWVLGGGLAVYISATFYKITASGIWFDEAFSAYITRFNFFDIAKYTASDVHPPLYYWVLKVWTTFFGTSEVAFRSLSVLFAIAAIVTAFLLVKKLFGRKAAWLTVLFLSVSPMLIRYGIEARMYTMAAAIAILATYTLTVALESKRRKPWVIYGILISLGMWTHYFMALVWLAHWAWRYIVLRQSGLKKQKLKKAFFSKNWIMTHVLAIVIFLPWIPFMIIQLGGIQGSGFWIGLVGVDTLNGYMTNVLFYQEHGKANGWYAVATGVITFALAFLAFKLYPKLNKKEKQNYLLIIALALIPVLLLLIFSLPPLRSSFVERYLMPSIVGFGIFSGVTIALGMNKLKKVWSVGLIGIMVVSMLVGISNVYYYGNYNKNSNVKVYTAQLVKDIQAKNTGEVEPIIASSPWIFYEAIFYNTDKNPVYFIDQDTRYKEGSLVMLKDNDQFKIKDLKAFEAKYKQIWYIGNSGSELLSSPHKYWTQIQTFSVHDSINNEDPYKAVEYYTY